MISWFKKLWRNDRGNALMIAGAMLPLVVGAAGLATDTIQWTLWKRQLQRAADSAAIAGVYTRQAANGATTTVSTAVSHDLVLNDHTWMALLSGYPQVTFPANSGVKTNQVKVVLSIQQRLPFSSMFMPAPPIITATSTAATVPAGGTPCFHALDPSALVIGLNFSGNAGIESPDCDGFSDAGSANASVAKGSSDVTLNSIGGVGGIQQSNNFHVTAYRPYSPYIPDPFASVTPDPSAMNCATKTVVQGGKNVTTEIALDESTDLSQFTGKNCFSSLSVGSGKTLTLPSGTYYIDAGDAFIQGSLTCTSCTIVLTNKDPLSTTIGNLKVNASATINMTAPSDTTNPYHGIAIYQDRRAPDCNSCNKVNGNSGSIVQGAFYFPSQELEYNGTGTTNAICSMFVARRLTFSGNSATTNKFRGINDPICAAFGLGGGPAILMVRLVS